MVKVLAARVNWSLEYDNIPVLEVLLDYIPSWDDHRWTRHPNEPFYFSELDVSFYTAVKTHRGVVSTVVTSPSSLRMGAGSYSRDRGHPVLME